MLELEIIKGEAITMLTPTKVRPDRRLTVVSGMCKLIEQKDLSPMEDFVALKAAALFLASGEVYWEELNDFVAKERTKEMPENEESITEAIRSLEVMRIISFGKRELATMRIGHIVSEQSDSVNECLSTPS